MSGAIYLLLLYALHCMDKHSFTLTTLRIMHKSEDDTKVNIKIRSEDVVWIKLQTAVVDASEQNNERQNFTTIKMFLY